MDLTKISSHTREVFNRSEVEYLCFECDHRQEQSGPCTSCGGPCEYLGDEPVPELDPVYAPLTEGCP